MKLLLVVAILIFAFVVVASALKSKTGQGEISFPYQKRSPLFSAAERSFLGVLDQAMGPTYRIFGKVRIADVAQVKPGLTNSARQAALNRIAAKHFDFVICKASDLSIVCAIELNDKSHASNRAKARDDLVAGVCRVIGLPLVSFPAQTSYVVSDIQLRILSAISSNAPAVGV